LSERKGTIPENVYIPVACLMFYAISEGPGIPSLASSILSTLMAREALLMVED
jgi:hypothetical protein